MRYQPTKNAKNAAKISSSSAVSEPKNIVSEQDKLESFLEKKSKIFLFAITALSFLMAMLLFNPDVSVGGDDSTYLESAYKYAEGKAFPTWQGPFYPMFIGLTYKIFGFHIILFKFLSVLFFSASVFFTYKLFAKFANYTTATVTSLICSISLMLLNYASTTYTEPMFMFLQVLFLYLLLLFGEKEASWTLLDNKIYWRKVAISYFGLAVLAYTMFQTRSLAIVIIPAVLLWLVVKKNYRPAAVFGIGAIICHAVSSIYRKVIWNVESVSFSQQLDSILLVNPYKPREGYEQFGGFCQRFFDNASLYLSKHLMKLFGFRDYDSREYNMWLGIALIVILLSVGVYIFKKSKTLFAVFCYTAMMVGVTFVMLQKLWDQERLIMIYFPLILGMFLFVLTTLKLVVAKLFSLLILVTVGFQTLVKGNFDLSDNFDNGSYSSYTDDWRNYMSASKWAAENLPEGSVVLCRKPQMSWMASEGSSNLKFQGVYKLQSSDPDTMRSYLLDTLKGTHVIMANLRLNPYVLDGKTITTVRYSLRNVTAKYPYSLKLVKQFGTKEPAYLFEFVDYHTIDYDNLFNSVIIEPKNSNAWDQLCVMALKGNDIDKILSLVSQWKQFCGESAKNYFFEGIAYVEKQRFEEALAAFDNSIKLEPNNPDSYVNKAISLHGLKRYKEALDAYNEGILHGVNRAECVQLERELMARQK